MAVMIPDVMTVECDDCGEEHDFNTTQFCGDGSTQSAMVGIESETLEAEGWEMDGNETYCAACVKKRNGDD